MLSKIKRLISKDKGHEDIAVTRFREYLRVKTVLPDPDYEGCCQFLTEYAAELGIAVERYEPKKGFPFIVMTIPGSDPNLPSLMLYSHVDVVPVFPYSEAIRRLFKRGKRQFLRTIHIVWGADEELGGSNGMDVFADTAEFKALNVGFALDEGIASESGTYRVFYGERSPWWLKVTFPGQPGHASAFVEDSAAEKMRSFINSALGFREEQKSILKAHPTLTVGDLTTLNLTIVKGGVMTNVVPEKFECHFDIRINPKVDFVEFEKKIRGWAEKAGKGVEIEFLEKAIIKNMTPITMNDPFWAAFEKTLTSEGCTFTKEIFPAATDSRFLRKRGYRSIGFSPMNRTPALLHDHNECLNEKVFLRGVEIYEKLIANLANVKKEIDETSD